MFLARDVDVFGAETALFNHILLWLFLRIKILILRNVYQFTHIFLATQWRAYLYILILLLSKCLGLV
jgi:hypothetical protein